MKAIIQTISPNGFAVTIESDEFGGEKLAGVLAALPGIERQLIAAGYQPNATREWPKTPTGEPICPKHGAPMRLREKQGDTWYSHKITAPDGSEHYCRGYADKSSPGWEID